MSEAILSFSIVVSIQLLFFLAFAKFYKYSWTKTIQILIISMLVGIPVGYLVDYGFGHVFELYTYELGYGLGFILLNGIFSFGFMIATVALVRTVPPKEVRPKIQAANIMLGLAVVCYGVAWYWVDSFFLTRIITGLSLLAIGEYFLLRAGFEWFTQRLRSVGLVALISVGCGLIYEPVNQLFPVWIWDYGSIPFYVFEFGVITFGYIALGYVMYGAFCLATRLMKPSSLLSK